MKIDHIVVNIDRKYQINEHEINLIKDAGLPYEPKWGKGTKGFKASNIWIGNEYLEMIHLLKEDGGGWKQEWVEQFNNGHRGPICLMLEVDNLDYIYEQTIKHQKVHLAVPKFLQFKWGFGLFTRTMPWRNSYYPFFECVPLQIGLQQMKDEKSKEFMRKYMVPNARDNGIDGIKEIFVEGSFTEADFELITYIFNETESLGQSVVAHLDHQQKVIFKRANDYKMYITTASNRAERSEVSIENMTIQV